MFWKELQDLRVSRGNCNIQEFIHTYTHTNVLVPYLQRFDIHLQYLGADLACVVQQINQAVEQLLACTAHRVYV